MFLDYPAALDEHTGSLCQNNPMKGGLIASSGTLASGWIFFAASAGLRGFTLLADGPALSYPSHSSGFWDGVSNLVKRLSDLPEGEAKHLAAMPCPRLDDTPALPGKPLAERRIAIVSTAGLHRRGDRPFEPGDASYRLIPGDTAGSDLLMSHISVNFDRTGFQQDLNVVFPVDRLRELADDGEIGSTADVHYSFMGAISPEMAEPNAQHMAGLLKADQVDGVLLVPV